VVVVGALLLGGVVGGLAWVGIVNAGEVAVGDQFAVVVDALEPMYWVQLAGIAIYALAQLIFAAGVLFGRGEAVAPLTSDVVADTEPLDEAPPISVSRLRWGAVGLFAAAAVIALVLPAVQTDLREATRRGDDFRSYDGSDVQFSFDLVDALGADVAIGVTLSGDAVAKGRRVYLAEGCFYCHTQEVRGIVTDVGLGPVSLAGDYANEVPSSRGIERTGPDLMHFGTRTFEALLVPAEAADPVGQVDRLADRLRSPRDDVAWSIMPDYSYLTISERRALATYLLSLQ
jgi:mono/diheme cytochrome c family protein